MKEQILESAEHNTNCDGYREIKWIKLNSIDDIHTVFDLLSEQSIWCLDHDKKMIINDIYEGITFAFFYNEDDKLVFER